MIRCPNCGTANRKGSRFCNECGSPLPGTGLRCPMCGANNPVGNVYCQKCNARLTPLVSQPQQEETEEERGPIKGVSLPSIPLEEEEDSDDWLSQLRGSALEEEEEIEEEIAPEEPAEQDEVPDWLQGLKPLGEEAAPMEETEIKAKVETSEKPERAEVPDWLRDAAPPESEIAPAPQVEASPSTEESERAEVPDWLRDAEPLRTEEEAEAEATAEPEEADIPDWLRDLVPHEAPPPSATDRSREQEQPNWLEQAEDIEVEAEAEVETEVEVETEAEPEEMEEPEHAEVPDWLRDAAPQRAEAEVEVETEAEPEEMEEPERAEVPDWLRDAAPQRAEAEVEVETEAEPEEMEEPERAEVPDWLRDVAPQQAEAETKAEEMEEPGRAEAPDWLGDAALSGELEDAEIPDWLRDLPPRKPEGAPPAAEAPPEGSPALAEADIPDWLRAAAPPGEVPSQAAQELPDGLVRAEIPDWLAQLRPTADAPGAAVEREPMETEGLLEGMRGVIPAATAIEAPTTHDGLPSTEPSEASVARAQLLQSLLAQPVEKPQHQKRARGVDLGAALQRLLVAVVLLLATGGILMAPLIPLDLPKLTEPVASPRAAQAHQLVQELGVLDNVLVVFDYGPAEMEELNVVAHPVLSHLLERGANLSVASSQPEGVIVATSLLDAIAEEGEYDQTYDMLGYRPGDAAGAAQLLKEAGSEQSLLLLLTAKPVPLRRWIEQAQISYGDDIPIVIGVSAALEPVTSPYLDEQAGQLDGAIQGLRGAVAYEQLLGSSGEATERLDALAAGHVAIAGLMIIGAVFSSIGNLRSQQREKSDKPEEDEPVDTEENTENTETKPPKREEEEARGRES